VTTDDVLCTCVAFYTLNNPCVLIGEKNMASIRNAEIETAATIQIARLEKETAFAKATTHLQVSQLRVI
jgi:hypothetical protein